ncbi:HDOD domain-containing protein [Massilia atriviolacea]|uniref:HDOD domain-containing protein n=2 Tax=Massilia atriviolacea TaxID=2495579 RepID=A0A430HK85_9BURK|nr:HDOD domain-containing protein [Massilia atriviolacea]
MYQWVKRLFSAPEAPGATQASQPPAAPASAAPASAAPSSAAPSSAMPPANAAQLSFEQRDGVNGTYFNWLFDNADVTGLDTTPHENQVLDALTAILASQQSGAALVRRLPGLLPQLLQSLRSDNFSGAQLSRTISNDVVLVAAVIRMANTSFKGSGTTITSVEHAVMLIGQEGLRHLITSVAFRPIIDLNSGQYTRLLAPRIWDQSERCAVANRMLAEAMGIDPFEAFLAGLVQNVGLIVTLRIMDQMSKGEKELGSEMFCARLVRDARILTCSIGREWNFPESVVTAIGEQAGMRKGVPVSPLGQLLTQSDYLSKVRILVDNARLGQDDPVLFKGLSAQAMACYRTLDAIEDDVPAAPAAPAPAP